MESINAKLGSIRIQSKPLVSEIATILTDAILDGSLKGGDKLTEKMLKSMFGVSSSPIRETFRILENNGLVEMVPRKGAFIKIITKRDIEENFPIRVLLEGLAAREAFKKMDNSELENLRAAFERMKESAIKKDVIEFRKNHIQYHDIFINGSRNNMLIDMIQRLRMHHMWYRYCFKYYREDYEKAIAIHENITKLFCNKKEDVYKVEDAVKKHIEIGEKRFLVYLQEEQYGKLKCINS